MESGVWNWRKLKAEIKSWDVVRLEGTEFTWCYEIATHAAVRATMRTSSHSKGANLDNLPVVVTFEQVPVCCEMEVKEREWERVVQRGWRHARGSQSKWKGASQGQRVIRAFSVWPGKLSSLRDEKWLYGSVRVIEFCCRHKWEDG